MVTSMTRQVGLKETSNGCTKTKISACRWLCPGHNINYIVHHNMHVSIIHMD